MLSYTGYTAKLSAPGGNRNQGSRGGSHTENDAIKNMGTGFFLVFGNRAIKTGSVDLYFIRLKKEHQTPCLQLSHLLKKQAY